MDELVAFAAGHVGGKLIDRVSEAFRTGVIERWTEHRARAFYNQFIIAVEADLRGDNSEDLQSRLDQVLNDDAGSQLLFDAYRRVTFARSNKIGPRIIGAITGSLVVRGKTASPDDEVMFAAAESLSDDELLSFAKYVRDHQTRTADARISNSDELRIDWGSDVMGTDGVEIVTDAVNLAIEVGLWAAKLQSLGVMRSEVAERNIEFNDGRSRRGISWKIIVPTKYFAFVDLIERFNHSNV